MDILEFQKLFSQMTYMKENPFHPLVWINGEPEIGKNVYIGGMSEINAKGARVIIGDNCDIASFVAINCADTHRKCIGLSEKAECRDIVIENNVFIGSHSVIKGGAYIGHHSVIAAGTIVDGVRIPPYSLVSGNLMRVKEGYYLKNSSGVIEHNKPALGLEEEQAAQKAIRSGWVAQGKEVNAFENEFCEFIGLPEGHAAAVSSGTASLFLALWSLGAKGKKVAIPVYTCSSLRHAVAMAGAEEVLIDVAPGTPNIDLESLVKSRSDIAIIPHMFGIPVDFSNIKNLLVVEDCAQALGAAVNNVQVGLHGDIGIYSFYATKLITSGGQGGMVVSKNKALVDAVRDYREFDQRKDNKKRFNFQMTDIQAAIGRTQLRRLPDFLKRRNEIFEACKEAGFPLLDVSTSNVMPVRYRAVLLTEHPKEIIDALSHAGIKSIIPIEDWELLGNARLFLNAFSLTQRTVSLPIYPLIRDADVKRIIDVVSSSL